MKFASSLLIFLLVSVTIYAQNTFENNVFSIKSTNSSDKTAGKILRMYLPETNGFAPNVNVLTQSYQSTINEYLVLSINQFKQMKLKLINTSSTKTSFVMEYAGNMQGQDLHFYAIGHKKGDLIYLATAEALEIQWINVSEELIAITKSFKMKEGETKVEVVEANIEVKVEDKVEAKVESEWFKNKDCQIVFFAVLEGLYVEGIPSEVINLIVNKDSKLSNNLKHDFVFRCDLCHAAYEAFVLYQRRQVFNGSEADAFKKGKVAVELIEKLKSEDTKTRIYAMGDLIRPMIKKKLESINMSKAEAEEFRKRMLQLIDEGDKKVKKLRKSDKEYRDWSFYGSCQACESLKVVDDLFNKK